MRTGEKHTKFTDGITLHRLIVPRCALDNLGVKKGLKISLEMAHK